MAVQNQRFYWATKQKTESIPIGEKLWSQEGSNVRNLCKFAPLPTNSPLPVVAHCHGLCYWSSPVQRTHCHPNCGGSFFQGSSLRASDQAPVGCGDGSASRPTRLPAARNPKGHSFGQGSSLPKCGNHFAPHLGWQWIFPQGTTRSPIDRESKSKPQDLNIFGSTSCFLENVSPVGRIWTLFPGFSCLRNVPLFGFSGL